MKTPPPATGTRHRTLLLHIGDQKAGSTTIQTAFAGGQIDFDRHSVLYPGQVSHNYLSNHVAAFARNGKFLASLPGRPNLEKLAERFRSGAHDFVFLSGEQFEGMDPDVVHDVVTRLFAASFDEIRVICYLRPHAPRIVSSYAEAIKIGNHHGTLDEFHQKTLARGRFCYAQRLQKWQARFGAGLIVRPLIPDLLHNRSVLDDLIRSGMGPIPFRVRQETRANESAGIEDLMLLKLLQSRLDASDAGPHQMIGRTVARLLEQAPRPSGRTKIRLHAALARDIARAYLEDARAVDAAFMDGQPLFETALGTAVETAAPEAQSFEPETYLSADERRNIAILADTIATMLQKGDEPWPVFFRKRRIDDAPD